ncbi:hypothetical protein ACLOJK_032969 [Asimina triloba]
MEGGRAKRNMEEEDENMEQFFALLRGIRAAKELLKNEPPNKKQKLNDHGKHVFPPSFQFEDFMPKKDRKMPELIVSEPSKKAEDAINEDGVGSLDLNLSL